MNFELPLNSHKWIHKKTWNKCTCGCEEYLELKVNKICIEKLKLILAEKGYKLEKTNV